MSRPLSLLAVSLISSAISCGSGSSGSDSPSATEAADATVATTDPASSVDTEANGTEATLGYERPEGWEEASHGPDAEPRYDVVLDDTQVKRIDFVIAPSDWQAMLADMSDLAGEFGTGGMGGGGPGGGARPDDSSGTDTGGGPGGPFGGEACDGKAAGDACTLSFGGNEIEGQCTDMGGALMCRPDGMPTDMPTDIPTDGMPGGGGVLAELVSAAWTCSREIRCGRLVRSNSRDRAGRTSEFDSRATPL